MVNDIKIKGGENVYVRGKMIERLIEPELILCQITAVAATTTADVHAFNDSRSR